MFNLDRRQLALLGILLILVFYWLFDSELIFSKKEKVQISAQQGSEIAEMLEMEQIRAFTQVASIVELPWTGGWETDPFFYTTGEGAGFLENLFGTDEGPEQEILDLTGISWLGNSGMALINDTPVIEGDVIAGYTIDRIAFNYVIVRLGIKTVRLSLNE